MADFPLLKTGAVAQYPLRVSLSQRIDIIWFLDGSEQRFRNAPTSLHQWQIALSQLDESEMRALEVFFTANQGSAGTFRFTDPWTGKEYPQCSLIEQAIEFTSVAVLSGKTRLTIREIRSS